MMPHILIGLGAAPFLSVVSEGPSWSEIGGWVVAVLAVVGSYLTAKIGRRTGKEANAIEFSGKLMEEIRDLKDREKDREDRIDTLEKKQGETERKQAETDRKLTDTLEILSLAIDFIGDLFRWGRQGGGEPEPTIPDRLREWLGHLIHRKEDA